MEQLIPYEDEVVLEQNLLALIQLYYDDPILFCQQVMNIYPDEQQTKVILALYERKKVSVRSGRGCGKTWAAGIIIWHFLCTRSMSQVYITAATGGTLQGAIWPTLGKMYDKMNSIYKEQFEFQASQIKHKEHPYTWFAMTRTARIENPDAMAGSHAKSMLYIVDEASGVTDEMFRVILGSLTEEDNYLLLLSNPRRLSGFFFASHKPSVKDTYAQLHMSAINSAWVSKDSIEQWKNLYGEDSNIYAVEVLGEFPTREDESIIPWDLVVASTERVSDPAGEIRWGLDMGAGNDKSVLVKRQGPVVFPDIRKWNHKDTMIVVGKVIREYNDTPEEFRPSGIYVDTIGVGKGAGDRLKEQGLPIIPAVASKRAVAKKYIFNAKSEWWNTMAEFFRDEEPQIPNDNELIEQLTTMRSIPSSDGRFKTESKEKYKGRYKASPDVADALAMTFSLRSNKHVGLTTV